MTPIRWSEKRCIVLDMDGTVYLGNNPIEPAVNGIVRNWDRFDFRFLTNNTSKSPQSYVAKLNGMGIPAEIDQLLTPAMPLANFLAGRQIKTAYVVGNEDFRQDLARRLPGLVMQAEGAQCVILAYDTELTYEKLATSALLLQDPDIPFYATHPDLVCPSPSGPLPDVGSFLALYRTATGRSPDKIFGKPNTEILKPILDMYHPCQVVVSGDRLTTDKVLAERAGIDFVLVLSGEATLEAAQAEARPARLVVDNLGLALP